MLPYSRIDPALSQRRIDALRSEAGEARRARAFRPGHVGSPRRRLGRALIAAGRHLAADASPRPARTP
ncbi:MAG: hypothetical protein ACRDGL_03890 [Candidatus Limnocylindrales bacterium]